MNCMPNWPSAVSRSALSAPAAYVRDFLRADGIGDKVGGIDRAVTIHDLIRWRREAMRPKPKYSTSKPERLWSVETMRAADTGGCLNSHCRGPKRRWMRVKET